MQHDMVIMCVFKLASCYARDLPDCRCSTVYTSYDILVDTNKSSYNTQLELFGCTSSCNRWGFDVFIFKLQFTMLCQSIISSVLIFGFNILFTFLVILKAVQISCKNFLITNVEMF